MFKVHNKFEKTKQLILSGKLLLMTTAIQKTT